MKKPIIPVTCALALILLGGCQSTPGDPVADTTAPVATILPLEDEQTSLQFELFFEAEDNSSGVAAVEIMVRKPDLSWALLGAFQNSPVVFVADGPGLHGFTATAMDSAGNLQDHPGVAQAETMVPEPIIIVDRHGEEFDITNAVLRYYLTESAWDHGIGRYAIRPFIDPVFICPGEPGYLDVNNLAKIMAIKRGDDVHAYKLDSIRNREVVNDVVNGIHLAATY